ncbi:MAG: hypothetical protein KatS3mg029_0924 [Saprospiraceae bacterium]|nr:MAG: hypothetical protein KatS3mg029_0924 [Saprospiraceae bacterium]
MAILFRFMRFVPPALLFALPLFSQIQGKLEQTSDQTYVVSVVPDVDWSPPQSTTTSAQLTLRATSGALQVSDFKSLVGLWTPSNPIVAPPEAPQWDYFSFNLSNPVTEIFYQKDVALPLFSFRNGYNRCAIVELIDPSTDPFMPPNSANANIGHLFTVMASGLGQNAYTGNTDQFAVSCPPLSLQVSDDGIDCYGQTTTMYVSVMGGEPPYQVYWKNLDTGQDGNADVPDYGGFFSLNNMPGGNYFFEVHDNVDSMAQSTYVLRQPAPIQVQLLAYDATCDGSMDGMALVKKATGGTVAGDYQYYWNTNPTVSSPSTGFLDPGVYTVTVVDDNGCTASASIEVGNSLPIFPNPIVRPISCHGGKDGVIDLYPVGINPPFTFQWSSNVQTGPYSSAWQLAAGTYSVTVTDATGVCSTEAEFTLEDPPAIEMDYAYTNAVCEGDKGYLTMLAVENAHEPWVISLTKGRELVPGWEYEVEPGVLQTLRLEDAQGCVQEEQFLIPAPIAIHLEAGENLMVKYGEAIQLKPEISPEGLQIRWTPSDDLSCSDCPDPLLYPTESHTYQLTVIDSNGCSKTDYVSVFVRKSRDLYVPNAFSPNGDGLNDVFRPYGGFEAVRVHTFQVFDRWGGLVYELDHPVEMNEEDFGWDGTAKGRLLDTGTYMWSMQVEFIDGEIVLFAGEVMLNH